MVWVFVVLVALVALWWLAGRPGHWSIFDGVLVDLEDLSIGERIACAKHLPIVLHVISEQANRYTSLKGLNYRIRVLSRGHYVYRGDSSIASTIKAHRDWPWQTPVPLIIVSYYHTKSHRHWWQSIVHEVFTHIAPAKAKGCSFEEERAVCLYRIQQLL